MLYLDLNDRENSRRVVVNEFQFWKLIKFLYRVTLELFIIFFKF